MPTNAISRRKLIKAFAGTAACAPAAKINPAWASNIVTDTKNTIRLQHDVPRIVEPRLWDWPQIANCCRGWLEYLLECQTDGSLKPILLKEVTPNKDHSSFKLVIKPNVYWNNGERFIAKHVLWLFQYWCDSSILGNSMALRMASLIDPKTGTLDASRVTILDELTLKIDLPNPDSTFLYNLADYPAAVIHPTTNLSDIISTPIGTGAFIPTEYIPGKRMVFVRNEKHEHWSQAYDKSIKKIVFIDLGTDPRDWLLAAQENAVDLLFQIPHASKIPEYLNSWSEYKILSSNTLVARFNQKDQLKPSIYANSSIRAAISQAIDNSVLLELGINNTGIVAHNHHVAPVHPDFVDIGAPQLSPEESLTTLRRVGVHEHVHEIHALDDQFNRYTAEAIAAQLRDAKIPTAVKVVPRDKYVQHWRDYPFSITEWIHRPLGIQNIALGYKSNAPWNECNYSNPALDDLILKAISTVNSSLRQNIMEKIEHHIQTENLIIQPFWRELTRIAKSDITGAEIHPSHELHLHKLSRQI